MAFEVSERLIAVRVRITRFFFFFLGLAILVYVVLGVKHAKAWSRGNPSRGLVLVVCAFAPPGT